MNTSQPIITLYLEYCKTQKCLDSKTLKAYKIDLNQFYNSIAICDINNISTEILENYIGELHRKYKPKTVKRKIASIKAFFHYLEYKDLIEKNPFNKLHVRFREPVILPKTIPLNIVEKLLSTIYNQKNSAKTNYQKRNSLRDVAVIELLFATGMRISELCTLRTNDVNLYNGNILIYGKGSKERMIQIGNISVINILVEYKNEFCREIENCNHFFANQSGKYYYHIYFILLISAPSARRYAHEYLYYKAYKDLYPYRSDYQMVLQHYHILKAPYQTDCL